MFALLALFTLLLIYIPIYQASKLEPEPIILIPDDVLMEVGLLLDERGLRNLMQVSTNFGRFAEYLVVNGSAPLSAWSMGVLNRYLGEIPLPTLEHAYSMTQSICCRAGPLYFESLENRPGSFRVREACNYFDLMALSWLPTPEILLPEFMRSRIYKAQCYWSTEPQLFWIPNKEFTLKDFEVEMSQYREDVFFSTMLAVTSQPIFRHILTPFFMAHIIIPRFNGTYMNISPAVLMFIRRMSMATCCFDPFLILMYHLASVTSEPVLYLYLDTIYFVLEFLTNVPKKGKMADRIKSPRNPDIWLLHDRAAWLLHDRPVLLMASICGMNVGCIGEILYARMNKYSLVSTNSYLHQCRSRKWIIDQISNTPKGVLTVAAIGFVEPVEIKGGMLLPGGAWFNQNMSTSECAMYSD